MKKTTLKEYETRLVWLEATVNTMEKAFRTNVEQLNYFMGPNGGGLDNIHLQGCLRNLAKFYEQYEALKYAVEFMKKERVI